MKVKTSYKNHDIEFNRSLGAFTLSLNGKILDEKKGSLRNHKVDTLLEAEIDSGADKGKLLRAELKLGLFWDKVFIYVDDQLIEEKKIL